MYLLVASVKEVNEVKEAEVKPENYDLGEGGGGCL